MQLTCPNCGEKIPAANINIQKMTAVCPACSSVFSFDSSAAKNKRRKVKQPAQLWMSESDHGLRLAFRTNFRLDKNESFISTAISSLIFTFMTAVTTIGYLTNDVPLIIPLAAGLVMISLYYLLALIIYNETHIDINQERIQVSRRPLPDVRTPAREISLSDIERIRYEETQASIKEGYDTPRYHVWAETVDGRRKVVASDVTDDYAVFIAQRLNEYLQQDTVPDVSHLVEGERLDDEQPSDTFISDSKVDRR